MTRINVVSVQALSDQHLGAEYRELPRIFGAVRKKVTNGVSLSSLVIPGSYCLGDGHVTFFYNKLGFLTQRYRALCAECLVRGRQVNYGDIEKLTEGIPEEWFGSWTPSAKDIALNLERIADRGGLRVDMVKSASFLIPMILL